MTERSDFENASMSLLSPSRQRTLRSWLSRTSAASGPVPAAVRAAICCNADAADGVHRPLGDFEAFPAKFNLGSKARSCSGGERRYVGNEGAGPLLDQAPGFIGLLRGVRLCRSVGQDRRRRLAGVGNGFFRLPALLIQRCEVDKAVGDVGMIRTQRLFADRKRALVQRLGLGVAALRLVKQRQVVEAAPTSGWSGPSAFSRIASARL